MRFLIWNHRWLIPLGQPGLVSINPCLESRVSWKSAFISTRKERVRWWDKLLIHFTKVSLDFRLCECMDPYINFRWAQWDHSHRVRLPGMSGKSLGALSYFLCSTVSGFALDSFVEDLLFSASFWVGLRLTSTSSFSFPSFNPTTSSNPYFLNGLKAVSLVLKSSQNTWKSLSISEKPINLATH